MSQGRAGLGRGTASRTRRCRRRTRRRARAPSAAAPATRATPDRAPAGPLTGSPTRSTASADGDLGRGEPGLRREDLGDLRGERGRGRPRRRRSAPSATSSPSAITSTRVGDLGDQLDVVGGEHDGVALVGQVAQDLRRAGAWRRSRGRGSARRAAAAAGRAASTIASARVSRWPSDRSRGCWSTGDAGGEPAEQRPAWCPAARPASWSACSHSRPHGRGVEQVAGHLRHHPDVPQQRRGRSSAGPGRRPRRGRWSAAAGRPGP